MRQHQLTSIRIFCRMPLRCPCSNFAPKCNYFICWMVVAITYSWFDRNPFNIFAERKKYLYIGTYTSFGIYATGQKLRRTKQNTAKKHNASVAAYRPQRHKNGVTVITRSPLQPVGAGTVLVRDKYGSVRLWFRLWFCQCAEIVFWGARTLTYFR